MHLFNLFFLLFLSLISAAPDGINLEVAGYNYFTIHDGLMSPVDPQGHEVKHVAGSSDPHHFPEAHIELFENHQPTTGLYVTAETHSSHDFNLETEGSGITYEPQHSSYVTEESIHYDTQDRPRLIVDEPQHHLHVPLDQETDHYTQDRPRLIVDEPQHHLYVPLVQETDHYTQDRPRLIVDESQNHLHVPLDQETAHYTQDRPRLIVDESQHHLHVPLDKKTDHYTQDRPRLIVDELQHHLHVPLDQKTAHYTQDRPRLIVDEPQHHLYAPPTKETATYENKDHLHLIVMESRKRETPHLISSKPIIVKLPTKETTPHRYETSKKYSSIVPKKRRETHYIRHPQSKKYDGY